MRQVFLQSPWIHPEEPIELRRILQTFGKRTHVKAGTSLPHGEGKAYVGLLEKGLGAFEFEDMAGRSHIFALIVPGRCFGDLDALTQNRLNLRGTVIRDSTVILLSREKWEEEIARSPDLLKLYAKNAICKEEAHMEGMIANFTMDLPSRIRTLLRSVVSSFYEVKEDGWNPLPIKLSVLEISRIVAANRSSVSLVFSEWMEKGLIRRDGRRLIVNGQLLTQVYDWADRIPPDDVSVSDPF